MVNILENCSGKSLSPCLKIPKQQCAGRTEHVGIPVEFGKSDFPNGANVRNRRFLQGKLLFLRNLV